MNLAGEYMDVVLALTIKWVDKRLMWHKYQWGAQINLPVLEVQVDSDEIWTPRSNLISFNDDHCHQPKMSPT